MKSKIDLYNSAMSILCACSVIFAAAYKGSTVIRVICAVLAVCSFVGIIVKIKKGSSANGE